MVLAMDGGWFGKGREMGDGIENGNEWDEGKEMGMGSMFYLDVSGADKREIEYSIEVEETTGISRGGHAYY